MREFLSILIMPFSIFWILLIISSFFLLLKRNRASLWLFSAAIVWLLMISTRFIPEMLVSKLENQYKPLKEVQRSTFKAPVHIIVLGGGYSDDKDLTPNNQLSVIALGRLNEGIRLNRLIPGSILITSGRSGRLYVSQAEVLSQTAISLGVDSADIRKLTTTINTSDEAKTYYSVFGTTGSVIVVTDAVHMPRAMKFFRKTGLKPIAAPTNTIVKKGSVKNPFSWLPSSGNIEMMEAAVHEYAGLVWELVGGD